MDGESIEGVKFEQSYPKCLAKIKEKESKTVLYLRLKMCSDHIPCFRSQQGSVIRNEEVRQA